MATFEDIPLEILSLIAESLEDIYGLSKPFAHITEAILVGSREWRHMITRSRHDICNFRLVCRKTANSANKSFGAVIGNRTFHITPTNVQDLFDIWTSSDLSQHIKTLTFGEKCFSRYKINGEEGNDMLDMLLEVFDDKTQAARIEEAYIRCARESWAADIKEEFLAALELFPNLRCLRLNYMDSMPDDQHLQGWLMPGDSEALEAAFEVVRPYFYGTSKDMSQTYSSPGFYPCNYYYKARCESIMIEAITEKDTRIEDLRVYQLRGRFKDHYLYISPTHHRAITALGNLRRFDFSLDEQLPPYQSELQLRDIQSIVEANPLITDISIGWLKDARRYERDLRLPATEILCQMIAPLDNLQRICMRGDWQFTPNTILTLLRSHSKNLEYLVLDSPMLLRPFSDDTVDWTSMLSTMIPCLSRLMKLVCISTFIKGSSILIVHVVRFADLSALLSLQLI